MNITPDCVVALTWVLKDTQGELLDELDDPVEFYLGGHDLLDKIQHALQDHQVGDQIDLHLEPEDAFGDFDESLGFSAGLGMRTYLCYLQSSTPDSAGTDVLVGTPQLQYSGYYSPSKGPQASVSVKVLQFRSADEAIKGFEALKTQSRKCKGAGSTTWTNGDGTQTTSSCRVSTSIVS